MSIYYEIPQIPYKRLIEDLEAGRVPGLRLEYCNADGEPVGKENGGRPRVHEEETDTYCWLYRPVKYRRGVGIKFFGVNVDPERMRAVFRRLKEYYGPITPIDEEQLGIIHVG